MPKRCRTLPLSGTFQNKFHDDGTLHKEDKKIDKLLHSRNTHVRSPREKYEPAKVKCERCNQEFEIHPDIATNYYICESCMRK